MDGDERERAALERLAAETSIRGLLGASCRELVQLLDATACVISRVIGDLLVGLDEHTLSGRPLEHGHEYLISDFPLTGEVVASGEARWVSVGEESAKQTEVGLLEKLGYESLLMVCLPANDSCWGLVEVYREGGRFDEEQARIAKRFSAHVGKLLERLDQPNAR